MTTKRLVRLKDRLAIAAADDLSGAAHDGLTLAWPQGEVLQTLDRDLTVTFDKLLSLIGQTLPGWAACVIIVETDQQVLAVASITPKSVQR